MHALLFALATAEPSTTTQLDVGLASFYGSVSRELAPDESAGPHGVGGTGVVAHYAAFFRLVPGVALGPAIAFGWASAHEIGTSDNQALLSIGVGPELDWHPNPVGGFHVRFGFAGAWTRLRSSTGSELIGTRWSAAVLRDFPIGAHARLGGFFRLDADSVHAASEPVSMRTLVPSLGVVLTQEFFRSR